MMTTTDINWKLMRSYIVRIKTDVGNGTGFFVAPRMILTCAHVVGSQDVVDVVPADTSVGNRVARVIARSPLSDGTSQFWPYPDLAVLRLEDEGVKHFTVRLEREARFPSLNVACIAWGFAGEGYVNVFGSSSTFYVEGELGDGRVKLGGGQAEKGLSGAPLVCLVTRSVVGVASMTRDRNSDLGAFASPISALFNDPRLPDDLKVAGAQIRQLNFASFKQERERWHKTLWFVNQDAALQKPEDVAFSRSPRTPPSELIRADFRRSPYLFRHDALRSVIRWCRQSTSMQFCHIVGRGGAGKTRFAIELCRRLSRLGWLAGFWSGKTDVADYLLPRLIVFDYAETYDVKELTSALDRLRRSASYSAPVQVLVLTRTLGASNNTIFERLSWEASGALRIILDANITELQATAQLSLAQRETLFTASVRSFREAWYRDHAVEIGNSSVPDLSDARYELPLDVLFEALDAALNSADQKISKLGPADRVLAHESKYWRGKMPIDERQLRCFVAAATLVGADTVEDAHALIRIVDDNETPLASSMRSRLITWLEKLYDGRRLLNPLRPDRLGEALVVAWFTDLKADAIVILQRLLRLKSGVQVAQCIDTLARIAPRNAYVADLATDSVVAMIGDLAQRTAVEGLESRSDAVPFTLTTALLRLLSTELLKRLGVRLENASIDHCRYVAKGIMEIGQLAKRAGYRDDARRLLVAALAISKHITSERSALTFDWRNLASLHDSLGTLALSSSNPMDARRQYRDALLIRQRLVNKDRSDRTSKNDLAVSHRLLGNLLLARDERERARERFASALTIWEDLVDQDPHNVEYQENLAKMYDFIGQLSEDTGDRTEARELFQKSISVRKLIVDLSAENADCLRNLAVALDQLADLERDAGKPEAARRLYEESFTTVMALLKFDRDNVTYTRDVAISYERFADLERDNGNREKSRTLYSLSLQEWQTLCDRDPHNSTYKCDIAISFQKLADVARSSGRPQEARDLYRQALNIRNDLVETDPQNSKFRSDLASSYHRLADLARVRGVIEIARKLYQEALASRRILHRLAPESASYERDLSMSYHRLGDLARITGNLFEARRMYDESIAIRRELQKRDRESARYRRDVGFSVLRLADVARDEKNWQHAYRGYKEALDIRLELRDREPRNAGFQRDVGVTYHRLGLAARRVNDKSQWLPHFVRALRIRRQLLRIDAENPRYRRDLSYTHFRLAEIAADEGNLEKAWIRNARSMTIREQLVELDTDNLKYLEDLKKSYVLCVQVARAACKSELERDYSAKCEVIDDRLASLAEKIANYNRRSTLWYDQVSM